VSDVGDHAREERAADARAIRDLHREAFGAHGTAVAGLVEDLRSVTPANERLSLVVVREGAIVGHVMFTRALLDAPCRLVDVQVLSPLAVAVECRRQGIGAELVRLGLDALAGRGVPLVFLEGDPDFYGRLGFVPAVPLGFRKPSLRIPDAAFQVRTLATHAPWMTGTLVYSEAFWRHDAVGRRERTQGTPPGGKSDTR
jgi:putative acetyltransferase